ncbi:hypothetical protein NDU88_005483 [Pleurodeles waltl]|uniref:Uncharacterized protein n=1 Tax=Pleurodeles waltl TaxID=8319 RepID=A0AAV7QI86_PLEWA|nr:hypothetical protein NDU88_005483 [Pleurodeles waltl]
MQRGMPRTTRVPTLHIRDDPRMYTAAVVAETVSSLGSCDPLKRERQLTVSHGPPTGRQLVLMCIVRHQQMHRERHTQVHERHLTPAEAHTSTSCCLRDRWQLHPKELLPTDARQTQCHPETAGMHTL